MRVRQPTQGSKPDGGRGNGCWDSFIGFRANAEENYYRDVFRSDHPFVFICFRSRSVHPSLYVCRVSDTV